MATRVAILAGTIGCCVQAAAGAAAATTATTVVDRVRFFPAPDRAVAMVGAKFTGSNTSPFEGFQVLAEIVTTPEANAWTELRFPNRNVYRWVRYEGPAGSRGNVAEVEFYSGGRKLAGGGFGSPGFLAPGGHWKTVFDGQPATFFNSNQPDHQYVGLDLGDQAATARPALSPNGGDFATPQTVTLSSRSPEAAIRYTLDGTVPGREDGQRYAGPFRIEKVSTITAVAFQDGLAPSLAAFATIGIGPPPRRTLNSFHVGNSLTGNASRFPVFVRTAGGRDEFPKFLIGGSTTARLWNDRATTDGARFDLEYAKAQHPLDYFTLQPRDFDLAREADSCASFIRLIREKSPDVQSWLYAEWVEMDRRRPINTGAYSSPQLQKTFPALTWGESMSAMLLYNEDVRHAIAARQPGGKPVRVLPSALALGWARHLVDQGRIPGVAPGESGFYRLLFEDHVHVNQNGCYLVALTWFAALYGENPEGVVLPVGTTLTAPQAVVLQRLAREVVKNYPDCGLYEEGTQRCGRPEFATDGKAITLTSTTPGAWFRYTLDGTKPSRTTGYVYCGVISVQPGIQVQAIAYKSGMADSEISGLKRTPAGAADR